MGVLFAEGFESCAADDLSMIWDGAYNWGGFSIPSASPRYSGGKYLQISGGVYDNGWIEKNITSQNTISIGFAMYLLALPSTGHGGFIFSNADGNQCAAYINSDGSITVKRGSTTLGSSASGVISASTWQYIEIKIFIDNAAGTYEVKVGGVSVLSGTGADTQYQTSSGCTKVRISNPAAYLYGISYLDDIYIGTDFLGDVRMDDCLPTGAGNYTQFTPSAGNNYECVDDTDINSDTDYVSDGTVGHKDSYGMGNLSAIGSQIHAVCAVITARKDDAGSRGITPFLRIGSTDYSGSEISLSDSYHQYQQVWDENPADSEAWEEADVNGAEAGQEVTT